MNRVFLTGRLIKAVEVSRTKNDKKKMVKFSIAVQKNKEDTLFINCISFNENMIEYLKKYSFKGQKILVLGSIDIVKIDTVNYVSIIVDNVELLSYKDKNKDEEDEEDIGF